MKTILFLCLSNSLTAQMTLPNLPPDSALFASLATYYQSKEQAELQPFSISKKYNWLSYMPSAGITYTFSPSPSGSFRSRPAPVISFNANAIGSSIRQNKLQEAKKLHVSAALALEHQQDRLRLHKLLDQFKHDIQAISLYQDLHDLQNQILTIKKAQLDSLLIKPSDYLASQESQLRQRIQYDEKVAQLRRQYWDIMELARYGGYSGAY